MKLLYNVNDVNNFWEYIDKCKGPVLLIKNDGSETLNLKSTLSRYIAIGELLKEHGDEYELFCVEKNDEILMLNFFDYLHSERRNNSAN